LRRIHRGRLNPSSFLVLGEGLAAGMGDFFLSEDTQQYCFPVKMARQMGAELRQRLIQPPGLGHAIGFTRLPVVVPSPLQSTVIDRIPPDPVANLSVPGLTVSDAVRMRPVQPLVHRSDPKQTALNLILGVRDIAYGTPGPLRTQLEYAAELHPTFSVVELGYAEALEAAAAATPGRLPSVDSFRTDYGRLVRTLRAGRADVLVLTIPDPTGTAHFSAIEAAARIVKLAPELLLELWHLQPDDLIAATGLNEMAFQLYAATTVPSAGAAIQPLPPGSTLSAATAADIRARVRALNQEIRRIASSEGAVVYDLECFFAAVHESGVAAGSRKLSGDYLGGFFSLNGDYPGATGQALIANEILNLLNREFGASFPLVDVVGILASDPVAAYRQARGPNWTMHDLASPPPLPLPRPPTSATGVSLAPEGRHQPAAGRQDQVLRLPPGLEQVLPLNVAASYFGDAISAQNCRTPETIQYGTGANLIFGGLAMMDSHLAGSIRIKFTPPAGDDTTFQVSFGEGLFGTNSVLAAPVYFKMPGEQQMVGDVPGLISSGRLNLRTGEVDSSPGALNVYVNFFNSALFALLRVNPNFPKTPLSFPGQYGSACAKFEQRPDGMLDFTFTGTTFVPLGNGAFFPLNFCGPSREFASVPGNGTVLHPHLALSTKAAPPPSTQPCNIPFNTIQEFSLFSPVSSFGDAFTLHAPQLGGPALGRSRLLGRVQIQFGLPSSHSVPIAVSTSTAGGLLAPLDPTPLAQLFPGRLTPGPEGFYENLRFPFRTYSLNDLAIIDDPFDLSVGALDLRSCRLLHPLLHRAFINQDLIFALLRVEPRTPKSSFFFRGPAALKSGRRGEYMFDFYGQVHIPYPPGFLFPNPNLATGFPVAGGGALDPYLWTWAIQDSDSGGIVKTGGADRVVSSRGEVFSYRFVIPGHAAKRRAEFEYENHTQQGRFRMHSLAWVGLGNSHTDGEGCDTVTFTCFGVWSKDGVEEVVQAAAQISSSAAAAYVGIQIASAAVSNVNTVMKPDAFPIPPADLSLPICCAGAPASSQNLPAAVPRNLRGGAPTSNPRSSAMFSHIIELTAKPGQAKEVVRIIRDKAIPDIIRGAEGFVDEIVLLSETELDHVTAISFWRSKADAEWFNRNGFSKVSILLQSVLAAKPERHDFGVGASTNQTIRGSID
jgi:hypothetical protein